MTLEELIVGDSVLCKHWQGWSFKKGETYEVIGLAKIGSPVIECEEGCGTMTLHNGWHKEFECIPSDFIQI